MSYTIKNYKNMKNGSFDFSTLTSEEFKEYAKIDYCKGLSMKNLKRVAKMESEFGTDENNKVYHYIITLTDKTKLYINCRKDILNWFKLNK